jgi:hypothetical protein
MKNISKRDLIFLAVIIAVIIGLIIQNKSNSRLRAQANSTTSILNEKIAEIRAVRLENGRLKQEKPSAVVDKSQIKLIEEHYKEEVRDLKENHGVKVKDLHAYYKAQMVTSGSGEAQIRDTTIIVNDTSRIYQSVNVSDDFLDFYGYFDDKNLVYSYMMYDSLSIAYYWTKRGFWPFVKNDSLIVSFSSANQNTQLLNVTSFVIQETKKTKLTIGPYVGYSLINGVDFGISVQYPLIRIKW